MCIGHGGEAGQGRITRRLAISEHPSGRRAGAGKGDTVLDTVIMLCRSASAPVWLVHACVAAPVAVAGHARLPGLAVVVEAGVYEAGRRRVALAIVHAAVVAPAVAVLHGD